VSVTVTTEPRDAAERRIAAVVDRTERVAEDVVALDLVHADGSALPAWDAGAHADVVLPNGLVRQYSLCGDQTDRTTYRIAVLREADGRGGSAFIHDEVRAGSTLTLQGPRNAFPLVEAGDYVFIAGGIGITPLVPMVKEAEERGVPWRLMYGGRRRASMAFVDELVALAPDRVEIHPQDERGLLPLADALRASCPDTAVYCCGPEQLITAVESIVPQASGPPRLYVERFKPRRVTAESTDLGFEVVCAASGTTVQVAPEQSILEALCMSGIEPLSSCAEGTCGTCETRVLEGNPDHRDSVLTDEERASGETMMVCVSRCHGARLVLDL